MAITAYCDGACRVSNPGHCSVAFAVYNNGALVHSAARVLRGLNSNNVSEYTALLDLLFYLEGNGTEDVQIFCDSMLVVQQVNDAWACNKADLKPLCLQARYLLLKSNHTLSHVDGHSSIVGNEYCDFLCNEALDSAGIEGSKSGRKQNRKKVRG